MVKQVFFRRSRRVAALFIPFFFLAFPGGSLIPFTVPPQRFLVRGTYQCDIGPNMNIWITFCFVHCRSAGKLQNGELRCRTP